ncbi:hypothetical protein HRG84_07745 [Flavisolibacter sp. BT320]|nr:hypothetical protein [Flavisolibacter longurius]
MRKSESEIFQKQLLQAQQRDEHDYLLYIKHLFEAALKASGILFGFNWAMFDQTHPANRFYYIKVIAHKVMFFPEELIIQKLRELGLSEEVLIRFIPLDDITDQLDKIANTNTFFFQKSAAIGIVYAYAHAKLNHAINENLKTVVKDLNYSYVPDFKRSLNNIYDQRKYHGGTPRKVKDPHKQRLHEMLDNLEQYLGKKDVEKFVKHQVAGRNIEAFLLRLIIEICQPTETTDEFHAKFFDLFRLLMPEKTPHLSQDDIDNTEHYYGKTFAWYKAKWVRNAIRGVSSFSGSSVDIE